MHVTREVRFHATLAIALSGLLCGPASPAEAGAAPQTFPGLTCMLQEAEVVQLRLAAAARAVACLLLGCRHYRLLALPKYTLLLCDHRAMRRGKGYPQGLKSHAQRYRPLSLFRVGNNIHSDRPSHVPYVTCRESCSAQWLPRTDGCCYTPFLMRIM